MQTQEIKGNLARLLATENLIVEHRKTSTASFDVDRRVLTLPMWDKASGTVYDMLVGHEVGHALFTPNDDWRCIADCPKDFVNVIEDARIEKLMKRKFPGLRKSFSIGYRELNDKDFFDVAGHDLSKFSLIDRINLHFKIGASAMIPFSIEEQVFVARTDLAETFEEVLQIANDVYIFSNKTEEVTEMPVGQQPEEGETESNDVEQSEQQSDENAPAEMPEAKTNNAGPIQNDDEEEEEDEEDEFEEDGYEGGDTSETQNAFDRASERLSTQSGRSPIYVEIPTKVNLDKHVVDWTTLHDWIDLNIAEPEKYEETDNKYYEFRKQSQKEVNYLVKEFECRKSADAYARAGQSKTGVLDTSKLHTYRYNEDLFKKVTVVPDGKNHGMLFILDWSGSMANEILATVKQLLNLTAFCKKVQIPFEVYAFTNEWVIAERCMEGTQDQYYEYQRRGLEKNTIHMNEGYFHMMNFLSSRSNAKDYERMCKNLWREAYYYRHGYVSGYRTAPGLGLSGTPLNEAVVMMNYIVPDFKKQNDLQKVNICILSDGESCNIGYGHEVYNDHKDEHHIVPRRIEYYQTLRDRTTGITYETFDYDNVTNIFLKQLRDRNPGVNVLGFRILSGSQLQSFVGRYASYEGYGQIQKQWKKERSAIITNPKAFSALYAISNNSLNESTDFNVESGAKKGEITRAFKKMLGSKSTNKKLLSSFIEYVS